MCLTPIVGRSFQNDRYQRLAQSENAGKIHLTFGEYSNAREKWLESIKLASSLKNNEHLAYSYYNYGLCLIGLDSTQAARDAMQEAANANLEKYIIEAIKIVKKIDSLGTKAEKNIQTYIELGNLKSQLALPHKAAEDFGKAITLNPKYDSAYFSRGIVQSTIALENSIVNTGEMQVAMDSAKVQLYISLALSDFNQTIMLNPKFADALVYRGRLLNKLGKQSEALKDYDSAITISPNLTWAYSNRASLYKEQKKYMEAISDFTKAIALDSANKDYYVSQRMQIKEKVRDFKGAIEDVEYFIVKSSPSAYSQRASYQLKAKNYNFAKEDFMKASQLSQLPNEKQGFVNAANAVQTIVDVSKDVERNPQDSKLLQKRGQNLYWLQDYASALVDLDKAILLDKSNPELYNIRGLIKHALEDFTGAVDDFSESITGKEDKFVYYHRFMSWQKIGQKDMACADLKAAKKLGYPNLDMIIQSFCGK